MIQVFSIERWYPPTSPNGDRWERVARVSNRQEAEQLVALLQLKDKSIYYSFFPDDQEVYGSAEEYLMSLIEERQVSQ